VARAITAHGFLTAGIQGDLDQNRILGRSFIIPAYSGSGLALFAYGRYLPAPGHLLHAGVRIDMKKLHTQPYTDWYPSPLVVAGDTMMIKLSRASSLERRFRSPSWSMGYIRNFDKASFKFNVAQGFRNPMPQELAANGINYHQFSFEVGDSTLSPEVAYQADIGFSYAAGNLAFEITPFISFSPNYIFLNPTADFDRLYGAGHQIYQYHQSAVLRSGGEFHLHYDFKPWLRAGTIIEYSQSVQRSGPKSGFSLPFAPPLSAILNLQINGKNFQKISSPWISLDWIGVAGQQRIVPPEEPTPGYMLLNITAGARLLVRKAPIEVILGIQNLLNTRYLEHMSYYRMINIPGPGRNVTLQLYIPVSGTVNGKR
jgi:iron complex outermembrane recepter protein